MNKQTNILLQHFHFKLDPSILVKSEAFATWCSEFMAFTEVFKHHHAGSGKRSGSMLDPSSFNRSILFSITCTPLLLPLLPSSYQVKGPKPA